MDLLALILSRAPSWVLGQWPPGQSGKLSGSDQADADRVVWMSAQAYPKYGGKPEAKVNPVKIQTEPLPAIQQTLHRRHPILLRRQIMGVEQAGDAP